MKVTYCKRKKGLLKKSIELSILCDLQMFIFIYDKQQKRVIHFASDQTQDFMEMFNQKNQREFFSNQDVSRFTLGNRAFRCPVLSVGLGI